MNWKIILQLSMFGFIMAFGTISLIPEKGEFFFWLVIFAFCAYVIAKVCDRNYFMTGFMVSIFNSIYITAAHAYFYNAYMANHPEMAKMTVGITNHPIVLMVVLGPFYGALFGLIQGLFAFAASKMVKK
jgi:hypothetical protein